MNTLVILRDDACTQVRIRKRTAQRPTLVTEDGLIVSAPR